ncbi:unnamed protein product [Clonostachys rosea]|uniref:Uncharacterized protein n=1 Tax=Bionectria ochroleuca TaxID=29856 RepID=A0ABY6ULI0_BIOOC|nr:unnamed protein product [Clonostachys rosea]
MSNVEYWFPPPDYRFDGTGSELSIGTIIKHPSRPTANLVTLGSGSDHPSINLPEIRKHVEQDHVHCMMKETSLGARMSEALMNFFVFGGNVSNNISISRQKSVASESFDIEVHCYQASISHETLQAIIQLPRIQAYVQEIPLRTRPVYIISGLRVALNPFPTERTLGNSTKATIGGSIPASISFESKQMKIHGQTVRPGAIIGFSVHQIRVKKTGVVYAELYPNKAGFSTSPSETNSDDEEIECVPIGPIALKDDTWYEVDFEEQMVEGARYIDFDGGHGN